MQNNCHISSFEVPKKSDADRPIIFHAMGDMDRHGRLSDEDSVSMGIAVFEERYSLKVKMLCRGQSKRSAKGLPEDPHHSNLC